MKKMGKILEYDGYVGYIMDNEGIKHIFTIKDLKDKEIIEGDYVTFISEEYITVEIKEYIARCITKLSK